MITENRITVTPEYASLLTNQRKTMAFSIQDGSFNYQETQIICQIREATQALELQPRLFVLLDENQKILGAAILPRAHESTYQLQPQTLEESCNSYTALLAETSNEELAELVAAIPILYGTDSAWSECIQSQDIAEVPLNISLLYQRLKKRDDACTIPAPYPRGTAHINLIIEHFGRSATSLLSCVKDEHDCKKASDMAFRYPEKTQLVSKALFEVLSILDMFELALYTHQPQKLETRSAEQQQHITQFKKRVYQLASQTVRGAIMRHNDSHFSWEMVEAAFGSLQEVFDHIFAVTTPSKSKKTLSHQHLILSEFFAHSQTAANQDLLAMAELIIEAQFFRTLSKSIPGEFQEACTLFYPTSDTELESSIANATGDTEQELTRYQSIIAWLQSQSLLPTPFTLLDAGVGHGRILQPLIEMYGSQINRVVGLDINPQRSSVPWERIQADLGQLQPDGLGGTEQYHMVLSTWSVLQDLPYHEQATMLTNISRSLKPNGVLVIDIASFENYKEEADAYHATHPDEPYGTMVRDFSLTNGTKLTKKFAIDPDYISLTLFKKAGFELVSEPLDADAPTVPNTPSKWQTKSGHIRHTFVLKKVREPEANLSDWYQTVA